MKKTFYVVISVSSIFLFMAYAHAVRYTAGGAEDQTRNGVEDKFYEMRYQVVGGTVTLSGATTFYGYGTDISFLSDGGQSKWTVTGSSTQLNQLRNGDAFNKNFYVPIDSPTVVDFTLPASTTLYYWIGGLKK